MQIVILVEGVYNDARHHAHRLPAGAAFETGHDYAQSLIASGLAELPAPPSAAPVETPTADPAAEAEPIASGDVPVETPDPAEVPAEDPDSAGAPPIVITPADGIDATEASAAGQVLAARKKAKK